MQVTIAQRGLRLLATLFLVVGAMLLTTARAQAQKIQDAQSVNASTNWYDANTAKDIMLSQLSFVTDKLQKEVPNTPAYYNWYRRAAYYKQIFRLLEEGETVPAALDNALSHAATLGGEKEYSFTTGKQLKVIYNETRELLK